MCPLNSQPSTVWFSIPFSHLLFFTSGLEFLCLREIFQFISMPMALIFSAKLSEYRR